jgi:CIC family chloride channel protein
MIRAAPAPARQMKETTSTQQYYGAAILIGILAGLGATGFHFLSDRLADLLFGWIDANAAPMRLPLVILVPSVGLFLVGLALQYYPKARQGGIREVSDSLDQGALIPMDRIVNIILSGLVLGFGGSVGPEGPMVQFGALAGSQVGRRLVEGAGALKTMVRAGAAAGIAGAFRSPAGGVLLTLEIFGTRFDSGLPVIGLAAVISYLTRTALLGREEPFALLTAPQKIPLAGLLIVAPLMGLAAAPAGHLFIRMLSCLKSWFPHIRCPLSLRVGLGGCLVGCIGVFYPQVMSAGYTVVERALRGQIDLRLFVILLFLKMLATSITFGSGAVGGLFAPTLFMGAMFGGAFGYGFHAIFPAAVPQPEVFVLLGMIVMFGSIVKGYWSGLLLVADMSGCYNAILLPGIIAGGISFLISWKLHDRSVFDLPLAAEDAGFR